MRSLRDTWLHYLADNLDVPVHPVRRNSTDENLGVLQKNAVNVQFFKDDLAISGAKATVSIDVIHDDENTCLDLVQKVWHILNVTGSIPKYDYTAGYPVAVGTNISWSTDRVHFRSIYSPWYFHHSCLLVLTHNPAL